MHHRLGWRERGWKKLEIQGRFLVVLWNSIWDTFFWQICCWVELMVGVCEKKKNMQTNHQNPCFSNMIIMFRFAAWFWVGATTSCVKKEQTQQRKEKWELVISVTMSDSSPSMPWQHKESYSIEPWRIGTLLFAAFHLRTAEGGRSRTGVIQIRTGSQALCEKWNLIARVDFYGESI